MIPKPDALVQWEEWVKIGRPRCCHTCASFCDATGWCNYYDNQPPTEFVQLVDACPAHKPGVPF